MLLLLALSLAALRAPAAGFAQSEAPLTAEDCSNAITVPYPQSNARLVEDCETLVAIKDALEGTASPGWWADTAVSEWEGVTVGGEFGAVTGLALNDKDLDGVIPAELGDLSYLANLDLHDNRLSGPIPARLADLSELKTLNLRSNQLTGPIPAKIGGLQSLETLDLSSNRLAGEAPDMAGESLHTLDLSSNQLTGGVPDVSSDRLVRLELHDNRLSGGIPQGIGQIDTLERVRLDANGLTGPIPAELGGLRNLTVLRLKGNKLTGEIPAQLGALANLTHLFLSGNSDLEGCIPTSLRGIENNDLDQSDLLFCDEVVDFSETAAARSVPEDAAAGTPVGGPLIPSYGGDRDLVYSLTGAGAEAFRIEAGQISVAGAGLLDHETAPVHELTVTADEGRYLDTMAVTITVTDVDEPPGAPDAPAVAPTGRTSLEATWAAPNNVGPPITSYEVRYRATGGEWVTGADGGGTATSARITGLARGASYEVQVRATNDEGAGPWSDSGTAETPSDPPAFSEGDAATRSVPESSPSGTNVGAPVSATGSAGGALTYSLSGTDASAFQVDGKDGQIRTAAELDYETRRAYSVSVEATDENGGSAGIEVAISVTDVDEPPGVMSAPTIEVLNALTLRVSWSAPENTGPPITGYDIQRTEDGGTPIDVRQDGRGTSRTISGVTQFSAHLVRLRATNDEGAGEWSEWTAAHTLVNEAPAFREGDSAEREIPEHSLEGTAVGLPVEATDLEGNPFTYHLITHYSEFEIDPNTGQITVSPNAEIDHEKRTEYLVEVGAQDQPYRGFSSIEITIRIIDAAEPPGAPPTVIVRQGSAAGSLDATWARSADEGRPLVTHYDVRYRISGDGNPFSQVRYAVDDIVGWATIAGLEDDTTYEVQVRGVNDEGESPWSNPATGTTKSGGQPGRPPAFPGSDQSREVAENSPVGTEVGLPVTATDPDGDVLTYSKEGQDAEAFFIDSATGQITTGIVLDHERKASYRIGVTATTATLETAITRIDISVTNVAEPPGQPGPPEVVNAKRTIMEFRWTPPSNSGPPISGYDLQHRAEGEGPFETARFGVTSGTIAGLTPATRYEVRLRAINGEGTGDWSASLVTSTAPNGTPSFTDGASAARAVPENSPAGSAVGGRVAATDPNGDALTYSMSGTDAGSFDIASDTGQISVGTGLTLDYESRSSYSVTVQAEDGFGAIAGIPVSITVTDLKEPPS